MRNNELSYVISVMLAVDDAQQARQWYQVALGATCTWDLGTVIGLKVGKAPFFIAQPEANGWNTPQTLTTTTARIELFCDDPEGLFARALEFGATAKCPNLQTHAMPWGPHRQGGCVDPFGHIWLVGDRSPLR